VVDTTPSIAWQDISEARSLAKSQGKDIFIFVHAPWCPKCEAMKTTTLKDADLIAKINTHFIPVMHNAQESKEIVWEGETYRNPNYDSSKGSNEVNSYHELTYKIGAESIPNILVMDQSLNTLTSIQGLQDENKMKYLLSNSTGRFDYILKRTGSK